MNEDQSIKNFTNEIIARIDKREHATFATTETGIVWVSFDQGQSWKLVSELIEQAAQEYEAKLEDLAEDYQRKIEDVELEYQRQRKRLEL